MPYANNQGIRIHYEVEGQGLPLVLQHGLTGYLDQWCEFGYAEGLKDEYQLVLLDARGHGDSDKPHNTEAYQRELIVGDVVAVLDDLRISKAHYFGYSLGGAVGFWIAKHAPGRFHCLILGGMSPYRREAEGQYHAQTGQGLEIAVERGMEAFVAGREQRYGPLPPESRTRLLANDPQALLALFSAAAPSLEDVLPTIAMPCLLFAGEADAFYAGAKEAVNHMPNASFFSLPALNHAQGMMRSDLVLPHVKEFLTEVSKGVTQR